MVISEDGRRILGSLDGVPESLTIPDGVVEICENAFAGRKIKTVAFPDTLERIGNNAFNDSLLEYVCIPASVSEIGPRAIEHETKPTWVDVDQGNRSYRSYHGCLIKNEGANQALVSAYFIDDNSNTRTVVVPNGVTRLSSYSLKLPPRHKLRLVFPESLESIESSAIFWPGDGWFTWEIEYLYIGPRLIDIPSDFLSISSSSYNKSSFSIPFSKEARIIIHPDNPRCSIKGSRIYIAKLPVENFAMHPYDDHVLLAKGANLPIEINVEGLQSLSEFEKEAVESLEEGAAVVLSADKTSLKDARGKIPKGKVVTIGFGNLSDMGFLDENLITVCDAVDSKHDDSRMELKIDQLCARVARKVIRGAENRVPGLSIELTQSEGR